MNRKSQKEIQVTTHMVRQFLQENEDTGYRDFHSNLLPGVDNVMGIRLPVLRKFAKQLSGMDWQEWFEQADDQWYEETIQGVVLIPENQRSQRTPAGYYGRWSYYRG